MSASTSYFVQPVLGRTQFVLIPTTLDDVVPDGHDVRILDELLRGQDWSEWEAEYNAGRGQPGIHPRVVASVILYGLLRRIRSSRVLEKAPCRRSCSMVGKSYRFGPLRTRPMDCINAYRR